MKEGSQVDSEELEGKISNFVKLKEQLFGPEMIEVKQKLQDLVNLQNKEFRHEIDTLVAQSQFHVDSKCKVVETCIDTTN